MVNLLETSASRIRARNTGGDVIFDTDERLFALTDRVTGSVALSRYRARCNNATDTFSVDSGGFSAGIVDVDTDHTLATGLNSSADTVRGAFSVAVAGTPGSQVSGGHLTGAGSFNASGTYIHYWDAVNRDPFNFSPWDRVYLRAIAAYTFKVESGTLKLNERVWMMANLDFSGAITYTFELLAPTFTYNLAAGLWV